MQDSTENAASAAIWRSIPVAVALGITTTVSYGTLYYAFGVAAPDMARDTGLSLTEIYGIFSLSLIAAAVAAPVTGRALDRFAPAFVLTIGSLASALLLALLAYVPGALAFAVLLVLAQMAATMVLYDAAFTVAAAHVPATPRKTITIITLIAGFASTIFWPLTIWLGGFMDWRGIYSLFALMHLLVCAPLHFWLAGLGRSQHRLDRKTVKDDPAKPGRVSEGQRRRAIVLIAMAFAAYGFTIAAVHLHLIGVLDEIGLAASAALIGALIGPAQVAGRLVEFLSGGRVPALRMMVFASLALPAGLVILIVGPAVLPVAAIAMIVYGLGQGLTSILRGILPLDVLGSAGYGAMLGKFNAISLVMMAIAPVATAALREFYGARAAMGAVVVIGLSGAAAAIALSAMIRRSEARAAEREISG